MKKPTQKQKIEMYESFLHKINSFCIACEDLGIQELVQNADTWSYMHRVGNGEISDRAQQRLITKAFWNLCETPKAYEAISERQKKYTALHTKSPRCPDCNWALYDGVYGMNENCCKGKEIKNPVMMSNFEYNQKFEVKPLWKLNDGQGATLCNKCHVIIEERLTKKLYCDSCKETLNYEKQN